MSATESVTETGQGKTLTAAWFSYFPVEWLPDAPEEVLALPRLHPASWQRVLLAEFEKVEGLRLHILVVRSQFKRSLEFTRRGVKFHLIKSPRFSRAPSLFWMDTVLIRRKLARIRPDVVHAWGTENGAALVASRLPYSSVVTMQGLSTWIGERVPQNRYQRLAALLERWSVPRAHCITTESNFSVNYVRTRLSGRNVHQVEHAPDWMFHRLQRRPQRSPLRFLFVGTPSYLKGTDLLLTALDRMKGELDFELHIIGSPEAGFMDRMQPAISPELWGRAQFRRGLTLDEVAGELSVATMVIFPTRVDTSPNSVKEAAVAGVPVVGSRIGGIPDYVVHGENGLLFEAGSLPDLIASIRAACRHPLFSQGQVELPALTKAREQLAPSLMAKRFLDLYSAAQREHR